MYLGYPFALAQEALTPSELLMVLREVGVNVPDTVQEAARGIPSVVLNSRTELDKTMTNALILMNWAKLTMPRLLTIDPLVLRKAVEDVKARTLAAKKAQPKPLRAPAVHRNRRDEAGRKGGRRVRKASGNKRAK